MKDVRGKFGIPAVPLEVLVHNGLIKITWKGFEPALEEGGLGNQDFAKKSEFLVN